jgi:hypothetical protein
VQAIPTLKTVLLPPTFEGPPNNGPTALQGGEDPVPFESTEEGRGSPEHAEDTGKGEAGAGELVNWTGSRARRSGRACSRRYRFNM